MKLRRTFPAIGCLLFGICVANSTAGATGAGVITSSDLQKRLNSDVAEVSFNGVGFSDVVEFLHDVGGINIVVDWNAVKAADVKEDAPITANIHHMALGKVVKLVLRGAQGPTPLDCEIQDNVLVISTADALKNQPPIRPAPPKTKENDATLAALERPADVDIKNETLGSLLKKLAPDDVTMQVDWGALKADGVTRDTKIGDFQAKQVPRRGLLSLVLLDASAGHQPLDYAVKDGAVHISTQAQLDGKK